MRMRDSSRHDEWVRLYTEENLSCGKIGVQYGVTGEAVAAVLKKRGIPRRRPNYNELGEQLQQHYPKWVELYQSGQDLTQIGEVYGVTKQTVARGLEKMGIDRRQSQELNKKYHLRNPHAFDVIDSEEKAYFLGLLMADGNVMVGFNGERSARVALALQRDDRCIVEALARFVGTDAPVHEKHFKGHAGIGASEQASLHIHDRPLADALIRCGCVPRKTFVKEFPNSEIVPEEWLSAFVRGYFDGNGCVSGRANRRGISVTFSTASEMFANGIQEAMSRQGVNLRVRGYRSGKIYAVTTETASFVLGIYHFMYDNATIYLPRKRAEFEELLGHDQIHFSDAPIPEVAPLGSYLQSTLPLY